MRNAKTFQIRPSLTATVAELSVAQALEIFWLLADFAYPSDFEAFLLAHRADALRKARELVVFTPNFDIVKLSPDEQSLLIGHFIVVNKAFFGSDDEPEANDYGIEPRELTGFEHYKNLVAVVNALVRFRHTEVLSYPMSLLNEVVAVIGDK